MIRRVFKTTDGATQWLLISQVAHARMSGDLVRNWREPYSDDVINAIAHHDDGWAAWEADPKLNPDVGAPYSFLEMPVPAALVIWDHSIAAGGKFGPLAAYIVAGHFYNLLNNSDHAKDPLAVAWLTAKRKLRTSWLDEWMRADSTHSLEYAKQAQQMLLLTDLFSLWLCCDCPAPGAANVDLGESGMKLQTDALFSQFQLDVQNFASTEERDGEQIGVMDWTVAVRPYPSSLSPLQLQADGIAAPAKKYASWQELKDSSWPVRLRWQLIGEPSRNGSAS